jgi:hypothetical protein
MLQVRSSVSSNVADYTEYIRSQMSFGRKSTFGCWRLTHPQIKMTLARSDSRLPVHGLSMAENLRNGSTTRTPSSGSMEFVSFTIASSYRNDV